MRSENLRQDLKQLKDEMDGNARAYKEFGCSSTPAPTPPGSVEMTRKAGVGAGLYNNQTVVGTGVRKEEEKKDELQHRGKPPVVSLSGRAGFSTPFPEGRTPNGELPLGVLYFFNPMQGGWL